ncbi:MAG TPA: alpha/beta hydrolase [Terriglobia bacterium]|nr:alpha/beta hydrolase [Terriglobia bacterium]
MLNCLFLGLFVFSGVVSLGAQAASWQPSPGHTQLPIWPNTVPDAQPVPGPETTKVDSGFFVAGGHVTGVSNVTQPTITVYAPAENDTGAAILVFPGGGFQGLAIDLEGTEVCDWLTSAGITCVLLKYRVPSLPYDWHCKCRPDGLALSKLALEDAQRAMGLVRLHANEWHINPHKVGVLGFSAGGYLVAEISTHFHHRLYVFVDAADRENCRPDFAVAIYPGHLWTENHFELNPRIRVSRETPPTFLLQAENDPTDSVQNSLVYFAALKQSSVPVEMHLYAQGGHAFGLRPTELPITGWPELLKRWLGTIGILPK